MTSYSATTLGCARRFMTATSRSTSSSDCVRELPMRLRRSRARDTIFTAYFLLCASDMAIHTWPYDPDPSLCSST